jgi:hypothetical protein
MALIALSVDAGASASPEKLTRLRESSAYLCVGWIAFSTNSAGFVQGEPEKGQWRTRKKLPPGYPSSGEIPGSLPFAPRQASVRTPKQAFKADEWDADE